MKQFDFTLPAAATLHKKALAGCVSSGDLEILLEPNGGGRLNVKVSSSVDGGGERWKHLFERVFGSREVPSADMEIHDFGATPGVVALRLEQALEASRP